MPATDGTIPNVHLSRFASTAERSAFVANDSLSVAFCRPRPGLDAGPHGRGSDGS